ncbi:MAG TPA: hypothetical protein VGO00_27920 [Kofleriaceae bacterium]|nr:hypothetical protein [Kofleriaceae bacterium]
MALLLHIRCSKGQQPMSKLETISNEKLVDANGGRQTFHELTQFANSHGFVVTSSTGGHHLGWAHHAGRAVDVRTRGHSTREIGSFMRDARSHGITVIDERRHGNSAWTGPHIHLQK